MSKKRRPLGALALIAMVVPISACGSSAPAQTGASGSSDAAANAQKAVKFAKCMRSNGVSEFPDPGAGKFTIDGVVNGSSLDPNAPAFKQAISTCKALEPTGFTGSKRSRPQQMQAALKFAQCIRDNGVKDFPDPANGQPLVDTNRIPSAATNSGMSILNAAMQKCRDFAAAAGGPR